MSRIFDALQRAESERSGSETEAQPQGPELLRRTERRVASKWDAAASSAELEETKGFEENNSLGQGAARSNAAVLGAAAAREVLPAHKRLDLLNRFQPVPVSPSSQSRLVCMTDRENPTAEALRLLGVRLRDLRRERALKIVLITSTIPQEGKSMIAGNLACALAHASEEKILLVEGDLRRPSLAQLFGVGKLKGICEYLREEIKLQAAVYHLEGAGPWLLPAGTAPSNPLELLQSPELPALMHQLAACFDWIIVDSPPVLPLADTSIWMRLADGILLVTRQGTSEKQQLQKGLEAIEPKKLLGALVNGTVASSYSAYYYRSHSGA